MENSTVKIFLFRLEEILKILETSQNVAKLSLLTKVETIRISPIEVLDYDLKISPNLCLQKANFSLKLK